ncbi:Aste57867_19555 [Aphanomyces stellatus]|uniref:Aste57867_19555 protein n=1 Tax=Aphanomyces stellatus TaxID=120398 RepID=A0A485KI73_9STRA|nr:hypothetical protein As57867_019491 [Aphanomyces stellatus]KAF0704398.1 hypothetical protein As57867_007333 [Aphanomyces stellatus]KAF0713197.1 hypothetical protein As57867_004451 [Aphanomyces stellatus]VFT81574.1 Aste57867_4463 [Aphanomyces stellatus]VFT84276.1 Aste57867_7359 [Aphanomyces stellatus]
MSAAAPSAMNMGVLTSTASLVLYGLYPLYFKQLASVPYLQICAHRVVWSFVMLLPLFFWQGNWANFCKTALTWRNLAIFSCSGMVLVGNWVLFMWGVLSGYVVETSLGFFINPIFSVILALIVFKEPLRLWQRLSVLLATAGVLVVAIANAKFPALGIGIAAMLSIYSIIKKGEHLGTIDGVMFEVTLMFPPSLAYLVYCQVQGTGVFLHTSAGVDWLLFGCGIVTIIPLLLFCYAAPLISFTLLGIIQYINPIIQFLLGVFLYHEAFSMFKLIGYICVWVSLSIFAVESILVYRMERCASNVTVEDRDSNDLSQSIESPKHLTDYKVVDDAV